MQEVRPTDAPLVHASIEGEEEHHEKKPVIKKVKEKVKKIKNTVAKKIHGDGDHDHDHVGQDYVHDRDVEEMEEEEEEEGYNEDEEDKLVDPDTEVHCSPMYDITTVPAAMTGRESNEPEKVSLGDAAGRENEPEKVRLGDAAGRESDEPEKVRLGDVAGSTVEDPAAPKSSNPPPRGGEEIAVSPIIQSFEAMSVSNKPEGQREAAPTAPTGSHDQFSPEKPSKQEEPEAQEQQQSYTDKFKSAAAGSTEYGKKIASVVYDKVAGAGSAVLAKVQQPQQGGTATTGEEGSGNQDQGVSVRDYIAEKLKPGEEDKALSEVISDAMHVRKGETKEETEHKASEEVTASEERSGGGIEHKSSEEAAATGPEGRSGGVSMVEKIRGAVTSLIGGNGAGSESRTSPVSVTKEKGANANANVNANVAEGPKQESEVR